MVKPKNTGIPMNDRRSLLFINGEPPEELPGIQGYSIIACTDGAFHYLKDMGFPLDKLTFISGDFDSHSGMDEEIYREKFIQTPDQDFTDFEKALQLLFEQGANAVDVYGASGGEQDHYLGNLHSAFLYREKLKITFYDRYAAYFFISNNFETSGVRDKMISLVPFHEVVNLTTTGLQWNLNEDNLSLHRRIGTRNMAMEDQVRINFDRGDLLVFIHK